MAFSDSILEARFAALEDAVDALAVAANNLATQRELHNTIALIQAQVDSLSEVDETQYETQLQAITVTVNSLQTAANNLATRRELKNLIALLTAQLTSLEQQISAIETTGIGPALDAHLEDDDPHAAALTDRYYNKDQYVTYSTGISDAGKPILTDAEGRIDKSFVTVSGEDHGLLEGLTDDDHLQYLNTTRGDARYIQPTTGSYVDLTDGGSTNLHSHPNDAANDSSTFSGTNWVDLTDAGATTLHKHDHGGMDGLSDDDHAQYSLANGTRSFSAAVGGVTPILDAHLATKFYVDSEIGGLTSDHGELTGLDGDDHAQYLPINGTRPMAGNLTMSGQRVELDVDKDTYLHSPADEKIEFIAGTTNPLTVTASGMWTNSAGISLPDSSGIAQSASGGHLRGAGGGVTAYLTSTGIQLAKQINTANNLITNTVGPLNLGTTATTGRSLAAGDTIIGGKLEVDGAAYFDSTTAFAGAASFGAAASVNILYNIAQYYSNTANHVQGWYTSNGQLAQYTIGDTAGTANNLLSFIGYANRGAAQLYPGGLLTNPTIRLYSNTSVVTDGTQWISFYHDQSNGVVQTGKGNLSVLNPAGTAGAILASGIYDSSKAINLGRKSAVTSHSLTAEDVMIGGSLEVNGSMFFDGGAYVFDNDALFFGTGNDVRMGYSTEQVPNTLFIGLGTDSNGINICEKADISYNFAHPLQTNPTLFIQSANQSTTEWISFYHDQTSGVVQTGKGHLSVLNPAGTAGTIIASGIYDSSKAINLGRKSAVTSHSLTAEDVMIGGNLEVNGQTYFDSAVTIYHNLTMDDSRYIGNANNGTSIFFKQAAQTPDTGMFITGTLANSWIMAEYADKDFDFAHPLQTNPTLFIQSANQSTTEWIGFAHDQTDGCISTGKGGLDIVNSGVVSFSAGPTEIVANRQIYSAAAATLTPAGTTQGIDWSDSNFRTLDLGGASGNVTVTFEHGAAGASYALKIIQAAVARTITWPASVKWESSTIPVLSTVNDSVDIATFICDGTNYYGSMGSNYG